MSCKKITWEKMVLDEVTPEEYKKFFNETLAVHRFIDVDDKRVHVMRPIFPDPKPMYQLVVDDFNTKE